MPSGYFHSNSIWRITIIFRGCIIMVQLHCRKFNRWSFKFSTTQSCLQPPSGSRSLLRSMILVEYSPSVEQLNYGAAKRAMNPALFHALASNKWTLWIFCKRAMLSSVPSCLRLRLHEHSDRTEPNCAKMWKYFFTVIWILYIKSKTYGVHRGRYACHGGNASGGICVHMYIPR